MKRCKRSFPISYFGRLSLYESKVPLRRSFEAPNATLFPLRV
jgi:hypothetical protein